MEEKNKKIELYIEDKIKELESNSMYVPNENKEKLLMAFMNRNEDIEIITPSEKFITQVTEIKTMKGEELELANTNDDLWVKFAKAPLDYEYAMARTVGIKGNVNEVQKCSCGD